MPRHAKKSSAAARARKGRAGVQSSPSGGTWRNICFTMNNPSMTKEEQLERPEGPRRLPVFCHWIAARSERYATFSGLLGAQELHQDSCEEQLLPNAHSESRLGSAKEADLCCQKGTQSEEEWHTFQWNGPNFGVEADFVTAGVGTREPGRSKRSA